MGPKRNPLTEHPKSLKRYKAWQARMTRTVIEMGLLRQRRHERKWTVYHQISSQRGNLSSKAFFFYQNLYRNESGSRTETQTSSTITVTDPPFNRILPSSWSTRLRYLSNVMLTGGIKHESTLELYYTGPGESYELDRRYLSTITGKNNYSTLEAGKVTLWDLERDATLDIHTF